MGYPTVFVALFALPSLATFIVFALSGFLLSWWGLISYPVVSLLATNVFFVGAMLLQKFYYPDVYRLMKAINEKELCAVRSGNLFFIPSMGLSLLKKKQERSSKVWTRNEKKLDVQPLVKGQAPPNVPLSSIDLKSTVYLDDLLKRKPITFLNFGSYT